MQCKQQEHDDFYTIGKQNVAAVLSPLSSNSSSPPTEPLQHPPEDMFLPMSSLPSRSSPPPSLPKIIQVLNKESMPSPPSSALVNGMDVNLPNSRKQKSPSPCTVASERSPSPAPAPPPPPTTTTNLNTNMSRDQIKYCSALIRNLKKHRDATPFIHPVDYVKLNLPDYPQIIKTPIDLTTIDRKLHRKEYSDVSGFINDIRLLFNNCYKFNGPEAVVSMLCQNVESAFEKSLRQMPLSEKVTASSSTDNSLDRRNESSPLHAISPIFRRKTTNTSKQLKRDTNNSYSDALTTTAESSSLPIRKSQLRRSRDDSIESHAIKRRKTNVQQLKFCSQAIRELKKNKYRNINYPFLYPVDAVALNIPDYHTIITHPMDISTIERHLANGEYNSAQDVERDVRLMFSNCYRYNPPSLPIHKMAKELESVFDEKWKHLPQLEPTTPTPSTTISRKTGHISYDYDDGDNASDEDDDNDDDDRIAELERHIASISQQIASLKSTRKKSSTSVTGTKSKLSRKHHPSLAAKPKPTATKPRRRTSTIQKQQTHHSPTYELPAFTFNQKKELSESINNLAGERLNTVVNIIQNSMPNLDGQEQDEIVLDIDLLDRKTLHRLHEFITGKSLLRNHHQSKKLKNTENHRRLHALEESMRRQINARTQTSSESGSSGSDTDDDSGTGSE